MLKDLQIKDIGHFCSLGCDLSSRLNLICGEKESGKSLLLNSLWWALTGIWPNEANPHVSSGRKAIPYEYTQSPQITLTSNNGSALKATYVRKQQEWSIQSGLTNNCIVLYAMSQNCFALYDPIKKELKGNSVLVMTPENVFDGVKSKDGKTFCEGLIQDWSGWQKGNDDNYTRLKSKLLNMGMRTGPLTRISIEDIRDFPTFYTSNKSGKKDYTPVVFASTHAQRLLFMAYLATWLVKENTIAANFGGCKASKKIIFLVDDIGLNFSYFLKFSIINRLFRLFDGLDVSIIATAANSEAFFDSSKNTVEKEYTTTHLDNC